MQGCFSNFAIKTLAWIGAQILNFTDLVADSEFHLTQNCWVSIKNKNLIITFVAIGFWDWSLMRFLLSLYHFMIKKWYKVTSRLTLW